MRKTLAAATATLIALTGAISAQDWPTSRVISMIIPFAPGGGVDASGRIQAQRMSELIGQTIVVENVGAAAGTVGSLRVAKAAPDGYTMLMGNSGTHAYSQGMRKNPPYNSVTDFAPIGLVTGSPRILLARKDLPANNMQEFVKYLKANHAKMQFGSAGVGSGTHLPCELLNSVLGVKVTHVPFKGAGPVMQELIAGRIDYMCDTIQTGAAQAKTGLVKGIAVMSPQRVPIIADLATTGEQGTKGVEATVWNGEEPAMRKRLEELGLEILPPEQRTPEYLSKYLGEEVERWKKVIVQAGIPVE
jgi:tripartite-type tricarboxylate transporter receptor subunit TctC